MQEMRLVVCVLMQAFDMKLGVKDGFTAGDWEKDIEDLFLAKKGRLPVSLKRRVRAWLSHICVHSVEITINIKLIIPSSLWWWHLLKSVYHMWILTIIRGSPCNEITGVLYRAKCRDGVCILVIEFTLVPWRSTKGLQLQWCGYEERYDDPFQRINSKAAPSFCADWRILRWRVIERARS